MSTAVVHFDENTSFNLSVNVVVKFNEGLEELCSSLSNELNPFYVDQDIGVDYIADSIIFFIWFNK